MKSILTLGLLLGLFCGISTSSFARAIFRGRIALDPSPRSLSFMTADQMATKVQAITGFYQSSFDDFARIIGTWDPLTGSRTNDKPTGLSILILEGLLGEVAESVIAREIFLDASDRIVFPNTDLTRAPSEAELQALLEEHCLLWFGFSCGTAYQDLLIAEIKEIPAENPHAKWVQYLHLMLQNGALYYL
jgi:hypothetical protein